MDPIQEQVTALTSKVDALHQMIGQVNARMSEVLANAKPYAIDDSEALGYANLRSNGFGIHPSISEPSFEHKDVLLDTTYSDLERQGSEPNHSPEVQIQRLTAQLTAAYNRIAALEEQLLAIRSH